MKGILFLLFAFPTLVIGQDSKLIPFEDVFIKDSLYFNKQDTTMVSGKVADWYSNGQLKAQIPVKNGLVQGVVKTWFESGLIMDEVTLENSILEGIYKQWNWTGELLMEGTYKAGKKIGIWKNWHAGKLRSAETYSDDLK
ncbi:MAG TPA: hypothetical protein VIS27_14675, partial [Yeosuana sp.]